MLLRLNSVFSVSCYHDGFMSDAESENQTTCGKLVFFINNIKGFDGISTYIKENTVYHTIYGG